MDSVDVVVTTYGNKKLWSLLAARAVASVKAQTLPPNRIIRYHDEKGTDIGLARNEAAQRSDAEWLIFLDADDELDPLYVESMLRGTGDLRWPSTLGIVSGVEDSFPVLLRPQPHILLGNHMVIGTMLRRELFNHVGGFRGGLPVLEDWDLWIRCMIEGAEAQPCERAIYRVHVRMDSRNRNGRQHSQTYVEIQQRYQSRMRPVYSTGVNVQGQVLVMPWWEGR